MNEWRPLKRFSAERLAYGLNVSAADYIPEGVKLLRTTDISGSHPPESDAVYVEPRLAAPLMLQSGDVLFSRSGSLGKAHLHKGPVHGPATFAAYLVRLRPDRLTEPRYIAYCAEARFFADQIHADAVVSTIANFNAERYANLRIPWHPLAEQRAIADFLDRETARIDALIAAKARLRTLLLQRRASVITRAVTKGLEPDSLLRESGAEWLGDIPSKWQVRKLRHIAAASIGLTYDPNDIVQDETEGTLVLRASNVQGGRIVLDDNVYVRTAIHDAQRTRPGDILICSRSGSRELIGKNARIAADSAGLTFGAFMTILRSPFNDFLFYVMNSTLFEYQSASFLTSTINQLTLGNLKSLVVPFPPAKEQSAIVSFLDQETARLDNLLRKIEQAMSRAQERRSSLITAAITGQVSVLTAS